MMQEQDQRALIPRAGLNSGGLGAALPPGASGSRFSAAPPEPSLFEYAALLIKHRRMILSSIAVALLLGGLYYLAAPRKYSAAAILEIGGYAPTHTAAGVEQALRLQSQDQKYLQTQVAKLGRMGLADFVLAEKGLTARVEQYQAERRGVVAHSIQWLRGLLGSAVESPVELEHYRHDNDFLREFLRLIKIEPVFATSLVAVKVTIGDPRLARDIANAYAVGFIEYVRGERQGQVQESLSFLQSQADELGGRVAAAEGELAAYAEEHELLTLTGDETIVVREISTLTEQLSAATGRRIQSESKFRQVEGVDIAQSTILDDESIRLLRLDLKRAEAEYEDLAQKVTEAYPPLQQIEARVASLLGNIAEQRQQALSALRTEYLSDQESEAGLRQQMEKLKQTAFKNSRELVRYNVLNREYESLKDLHESLLRQLTETQVSSAGRATNIAMAEYAALPTRPSSPKKLLVLAMSICLGALVGIAWALIRDLVYGTVDEPEDITAQLGQGLLGFIPRFEGAAPVKLLSARLLKQRLLPGPHRPADLALLPIKLGAAAEQRREDDFITISVPGAAASEAFRTLRTSLLLSSADNPPRVILVSSARQGDGKTTVTANLGVTLAQAGHRTVVVDADLRRRELQRRFHGGAACRGLSDYLTGQATLEEVAIHSLVQGLEVIAAGTPAPNPAELVGSRKMGEFLQQLKEQYEYVILDSPPVLPVADALMLAAQVDGVVFVVRSAITERKSARRALDLLQQLRARVLGVVLNAFDNGSSHSYGAAYQYADGCYTAKKQAEPEFIEVAGS